MVEFCLICGCPLEKTSWGRRWCPVCHQIIEEDKPSEDSNNSKKSYIG